MGSILCICIVQLVDSINNAIEMDILVKGLQVAQDLATTT
jgi:hypothetical protein